MLAPDEIEAAVLGAQWVAERGDPVLARAARDLMAKIETAVPDRLRPFIAEPTIGAPPSNVVTYDGLDIAQTRLWIRTGRKIRIRYRNNEGQESERAIWPVIIGYAETVRLLAGWCELRQAFRHFRTDRIAAAEFLDESHGHRPAELRAQWKRHLDAERRVRS
jgi:predicted DNA-binding transcriptional regulator YafY